MIMKIIWGWKYSCDKMKRVVNQILNVSLDNFEPCGFRFSSVLILTTVNTIMSLALILPTQVSNDSQPTGQKRGAKLTSSLYDDSLILENQEHHATMEQQRYRKACAYGLANVCSKKKKIFCYCILLRVSF